MNELYKKNIVALKTRYPQMANHIESQLGECYQLIKNQDGNPVLQVSKGTSPKIDFAYGPVQSNNVQTLIPDLSKPRPMFLVIGMGMGDLLFEALARYPEALFMVVESDANVFKKSMECFDYTKLISNSRIEFYIGYKVDHLYPHFVNFLIRDDHSNSLPLLYLLQDPENIRWAHDYYRKTTEVLKKATDQYWTSNVGNHYLDSLLGVENVYKNLKNMDRYMAIEPYKQVYKEKTGIVVSSGPSLMSKIDYLKKVQSRCPIVCADSSLKLLLSHGIKPFAVVSIERGELVPDLYRGFDIPKDILLFIVPQVDPAIINEYPGPVCLLYRDVFPFPILPDLLPRRNLGASCAHTALLILRLLGCSNVGLMGQDLAYERDTGKTHFDGVAEYAANTDAQWERFEVKDNQGGTIHTHKYWKLYRDLFSQIIRDIPKLTVFNVIEQDKGAEILGAVRVGVDKFDKDVVENMPDFSPLDTKKGKVYIEGRMESFVRELKDSIGVYHEGFKQLKIEFESLRNLSSASIYFERKKSIAASVGNQVFKAFDLYFMSVNRRFDAMACSLWTDEEFCGHVNGYVDRVQKSLDELIAVIN